MSRRRSWLLVLCLVLITAILAAAGFAEEAEEAEYVSNSYATILSLLPPVVAIALALITKEVYSSLFIGICVGGLLYSNFNLELAFTTIVSSESGLTGKLSDSWNVGILIFLVSLGIIVALVNRAGGSAAYGRWAGRHIHTNRGASLATLGLGALIFVDDYFNCLTVGSVMRPVTDGRKMSRAKLAYIIDSTAAPICIIAPISSWAAAVVGVVDGVDGLALFTGAIPFNFYAILTIVMIILLSVMRFDYGPMRACEEAAQRGDTENGGALADTGAEETPVQSRGNVWDMIIPVIVLILACIIGMVYTGGFFEGETFINAFANCDAASGLALGSVFAILFTIAYYGIRRLMSFHDMMSCIPAGFNQMVPAIMILLFAWTLSGVTGLLGADVFVAGLLEGSTTAMRLLPVLVFVVAVGLAFATGTSWGTFTILLPIVTKVVMSDPTLLVIVTSACLAGAVCGDHCSPISDTTIMASAGARCNHVTHVSTQLPYAMTVAVVSAVMYIIAGFVQKWYICMPLGIVLLAAALLVLRTLSNRKRA